MQSAFTISALKMAASEPFSWKSLSSVSHLKLKHSNEGPAAAAAAAKAHKVEIK